MIAVLIPFFLVAKLDQTTWQYGPEFIFNVEVNATATVLAKAGESYQEKLSDDGRLSTNLVSKLYCRPKGDDTLNCRLENAKVWSIDSLHPNDKDSSMEDDSSSNSGEYLIGDEPFEVKFNNHGIEHLLVPRDTFTEKLNMIRSIVKQLNIGVDLNGKPDGTFHSVENVTLGQCNVTFEVKHRASPMDLAQRRQRPAATGIYYELESLPSLNKVAGETIEILKTTMLNNCTCYASYHFGSYFNADADKTSNSTLRSSISRISVSDVDIRSETRQEGTLSHSKNSKLFGINEIISISLLGVKPAKEELPRVHKPAKTSIIANSELEPEKVKAPNLGTY
ncbi:vitellogenin-like [Prorops nasuta]|uniref:vitellogenin-like n=1 Tax=Prorops nasuta TaxID=863751 RepID=UPI0034CEA127